MDKQQAELGLRMPEVHDGRGPKQRKRLARPATAAALAVILAAGCGTARKIHYQDNAHRVPGTSAPKHPGDTVSKAASKSIIDQPPKRRNMCQVLGPAALSKIFGAKVISVAPNSVYGGNDTNNKWYWSSITTCSYNVAEPSGTGTKDIVAAAITKVPTNNPSYNTPWGMSGNEKVSPVADGTGTATYNSIGTAVEYDQQDYHSGGNSFGVDVKISNADGQPIPNGLGLSHAITSIVVSGFWR